MYIKSCRKGIKKFDFFCEKYDTISENVEFLKSIISVAQNQISMIENCDIGHFIEIPKLISKKTLPVGKEIEVRELKEDKTPKWVKELKAKFEFDLPKVEDTSQYEIENNLKPIFPITLFSGEVVNNKEEYLKSDYWYYLKRFYKDPKGRKEGIQRSYFVCEQCGSYETTNLHLHHRTYKNYGNENKNELTKICYKCHSEIHKNEILSKKDYKEKRDKNLDLANNGLTFNCELRFGKYKGLKVEEVLKIDKGYLKWLFEKADTRFSEEVLSLLIE